MVEVMIVYEGELRCSAAHEPSGSVILTDAPVDNHGKGEAFSPTDLVATALGTCMLTVMGIAARKLGLDISGARVKVVKEMVTQPVRRIGKLGVTITVPGALTTEQQDKLKNAALTCPVHKSLHPDIETPVDFHWA